MHLSPHFTLSEATTSAAASRLGLDNEPPPEVLERMRHTALGMEWVRRELNNPIFVLSWYRSLKVNKAVGGAITSAHCFGDAVDFRCPAFGSPERVARFLAGKLKLQNFPFDQLILEFDSWVHISFAETDRRQLLTAEKIAGRTAYHRGII